MCGILHVLSDEVKIMTHTDPFTVQNRRKTITDRDLRYPRPQLCRERYLLLDGTWILNHSPIRVPFPPESEASGFSGELRNADGKLVYEKDFLIPDAWSGQRILLHFGAVDQLCDVFLDNCFLGHHEGGYLPFSFDLGFLSSGSHALRVIAEDDLNPVYPYGKQCKKPHGMWYTEVSGIWQSVWIEPVPDYYIKNLKITPDLEGVNIRIFPSAADAKLQPCEITVFAEGRVKKLHCSNTYFRINIARLFNDLPGHPHLWTTDDPYLYRMIIRCGEDQIQSYFALRTVEVRSRTSSSPPGIFLNGKRVFIKGILDQGYFPNGIYVPDSPKEYARDILRMKKLGFNLLRKHVKVEPEQYYYFCDILGMLVMQDIVNSGKYHMMFDTILPTIGFHLWPFLAVPKGRIGDLEADVNKSISDFRKLSFEERFRRRFFEHFLRETLRHLHNHPCIIAYSIFNEGWGQYDSDRLYTLAKKLDPGRAYDSASGWFQGKCSDFDSAHIYYMNERVCPGTKPLLLSEVGGFQYDVQPEFSKGKSSYGYGKCSSSQGLKKKIRHMCKGMIDPVKEDGLAGYIYTQLSDVESERNGLYTYDRSICKLFYTP